MYRNLILEHAISSDNHFFWLEQKLDSRNVFKIFNIEDCLKIEISRLEITKKKKSNAQCYLELSSGKTCSKLCRMSMYYVGLVLSIRGVVNVIVMAIIWRLDFWPSIAWIYYGNASLVILKLIHKCDSAWASNNADRFQESKFKTWQSLSKSNTTTLAEASKLKYGLNIKGENAFISHRWTWSLHPLSSHLSRKEWKCSWNEIPNLKHAVTSRIWKLYAQQ